MEYIYGYIKIEKVEVFIPPTDEPGQKITYYMGVNGVESIRVYTNNTLLIQINHQIKTYNNIPFIVYEK